MIKKQSGGVWEIMEKEGPRAASFSFAFDTETLTYLDGKVLPEKDLREKLKGIPQAEIRKRLSIDVWAWQIYDEENGFYMTNDFEAFCRECCLRSYGIGWCYNATFDFSQIDYQVLSRGWKPVERGTGKAYSKAQPRSFSSIHSDMGARYSYKLWFPYRNEKNRHTMVHAFEIRDFMKFLGGGLRRVLEDLDVKDVDGKQLRKLMLEYQSVEPSIAALSDAEIAYCRNDVAGLYFAVKQFDEVIEKRSNGESHIFGPATNLMTAGGFAKRQLLASMYPEYTGEKAHKHRLKAYQKEHPMTPETDSFLRRKHLYRGGISFLNPAYKGQLLTGKKMYRYDVNSEYPFSMDSINDLVGMPQRLPVATWEAWPKEKKEQYEAAYMLTSVTGELRPGMLGIWYDPFAKDFTDIIDEEGEHLMFERELSEMAFWYDMEYTASYVIIWKRGARSYSPFIQKNYSNKAEAKNQSEKKEAKLELNSSYGKLAERLERMRGHYEINPETGAVHMVKDEAEQDDKSRMSVAVGALVTSFARCYILRMIRTICPNPARDFIYIDTDSIHCFRLFDGCDAKRLGALKCEAVCPAVKYIAPKTYLDVETINADGSIPWDGFEIHSKGISLASIYEDLKKKQPGKKNGLPTLSLLSQKMDYGAKYPVLMAMNVKGGKALVPCYKYLAKPLGDGVVISNMETTMLQEA